MLLDRKQAPTGCSGLFTNQALDNWQRSRGRRMDTFIGITDLQTNRFHLYPAFACCAGLGNGARVDTYLSAAGSVGAARENYGNNAIMMEPMDGIFDGMAHKEACRLAQVPETSVIGWAIVGNINSTGMDNYYLRFSSGRNMGKFTARRDPAKAETRAGRDLPKAWAEWVRDVIQNDLSIMVNSFERTEDRDGVSAKSASFSHIF